MARDARCGQRVHPVVTRRVPRHSWRSTFAAAAILWASAGVAQDPVTSAVQRVARDWLALTDRGDAGGSWDVAAKQFKSSISRERWIDALSKVRAPFGAFEQRAVLSTRFEKSFAGAPDSSYAIVIFRTSFAKRADGQETVTLEREADGAWRVVGYGIR
jgi:Protein of unknown function (DUF4019)